MFDKDLFDRSVYDRSITFDGIEGSFLSSSKMTLPLVVVTPIASLEFTGGGTLKPNIRIAIPVGIQASGSGGVSDLKLLLRQPISSKLSGNGELIMRPTIKTPIKANIACSGTLRPLSILMHQRINGKISGNSIAKFDITFRQSTDISLSGSSEMSKQLVLQLPLSINIAGNSIFNLRRIGTFNEDVLQLIDINLQPGEEVTIDTDLLDVAFGYHSDVSSVTSDSVFFELSPGENEIQIGTDVDGTPLRVTIIWQNRWL